MNSTTFTFIGGLLAVILLLVFIRNRLVTMFLGVILLGMFLINYNKIAPVLFNNPTKIGA